MDVLSPTEIAHGVKRKRSDDIKPQSDLMDTIESSPVEIAQSTKTYDKKDNKLVDSTTKSSVLPIPSSVIVSFIDKDGNRTGPPIDLPTQSTSKQLESLINALLENEKTSDKSNDKDAIPYAFYINNMEIESSLYETLAQVNLSSYEENIAISYQPLSVYKVRPVTRCTETLNGHAEAILHVSYSPDGKLILL